MATSEADVERRLTQNKSDIDAVYLLPDEVRTTVDGHTDQLTAIQQTLGNHTSRFDSVDIRLDGIDIRLDGIDVRLDGVDVRLDSVDTRLESLDGHVVEVLRRLPE